METHVFDLSGLAATQGKAIADALLVDSETVSRADFDAATGSLAVTVSSADAMETVATFVKDMASTHKRLRQAVHLDSMVGNVDIQDIDAALLQSPDVHVLGDGLIALDGDLLRLFRWFEARFRELAREFDAREHHYPVLVPLEMLSELGYLDHFPQHVTFCSRLRGSLPVLEAVSAEAGATGRLSETLPEHILPPGHALTPAVCMPCYRMLRGVVFETDEERAYTMQNHVFRFESSGFRPLARGWDFTVRDIVFFADNARLVELRNTVMHRAIELCREIGLQVTVELANDPFFLNTSRAKSVFQRMTEAKYELLFPMPHRDEALAASSFNLHRDFFTNVHGTRRVDGSGLESACMGFGLERWVYGFLTQKGLDPTGWPEMVTRGLR